MARSPYWGRRNDLWCWPFLRKKSGEVLQWQLTTQGFEVLLGQEQQQEQYSINTPNFDSHFFRIAIFLGMVHIIWSFFVYSWKNTHFLKAPSMVFQLSEVKFCLNLSARGWHEQNCQWLHTFWLNLQKVLFKSTDLFVALSWLTCGLPMYTPLQKWFVFRHRYEVKSTQLEQISCCK